MFVRGAMARVASGVALGRTAGCGGARAEVGSVVVDTRRSRRDVAGRTAGRAALNGNRGSGRYAGGRSGQLLVTDIDGGEPSAESSRDDERVEDFVTAGFYDPDADDADARLELIEFLVDEIDASI